MRTALVALFAGIVASGVAARSAGRGPVQAHARSPIPQTAAAPDRAQPAVDFSRKSDSPPRRGPVRTTRYSVTLRNVHTNELLPLSDLDAKVGRHVTQERIDRFLRCRVTGRTRHIAHPPFELALQMALRFDARRIDIISGYRSEKFNEMLRKKGHEVAEDSRHIRGEALDFRIPDVGARRVGRALERMHDGGIGIYPYSAFVHVDVGPDRRWWGT